MVPSARNLTIAVAVAAALPLTALAAEPEPDLSDLVDRYRRLQGSPAEVAPLFEIEPPSPAGLLPAAEPLTFDRPQITFPARLLPPKLHIEHVTIALDRGGIVFDFGPEKPPDMTLGQQIGAAFLQLAAQTLAAR